MTRPKNEMGSQIVSSESNTSHPILVYLSRNNNSQAQARRFPALTAPEPEFPVIFGSKWDPLTSVWRQGGASPEDSPNFRRTSLLSRNEFESGTFTIVLHATSSFTYVSVIYGANFPLKWPGILSWRTKDECFCIPGLQLFRFLASFTRPITLVNNYRYSERISSIDCAVNYTYWNVT